MSTQLWALAVAAIVIVAAASLEVVRSRRARSRVLGATAASSGPSGAARTVPTPWARGGPITKGEDPYIIYFTGESCSVCRTHQEPALARLGDVRIDKVDAVAERELADRFHVYTLPTTVVMAPDGRAVHVNYGYAPAPKLQDQLMKARVSELRTAATA